nr:UDP-2,3-diacylglucosamine diphosphatase [Tepidimonas alkaliphilus]
MAPSPAPEAPAVLALPKDVRRVDVVADLHLHAADAATAGAFLRHLTQAPFDALLILGDLFEVWVGDDLLDDPGADGALARQVAAALHAVARTRPVALLHGNRDFLLGTRFAAASGATMLSDPARLDWSGWRWLLSHGDAWCLDDTDYQRFRAEVREAAWQRAFLALPLQERLAQARALRARSQAHQARRLQAGLPWADVDEAVAAQARRAADADGVIHGHTHRPAAHCMADGAPRLVLSDWDAHAQPPRLQVLSLLPQGAWRTGPVGA